MVNSDSSTSRPSLHCGTRGTRVLWVECTRIIALLAIVLYHVPFGENIHAIIHHSFQASWVQCFFVLSGYFYARKYTRKSGASSPSNPSELIEVTSSKQQTSKAHIKLPLIDIKRFGALILPYLTWEFLYYFFNDIPLSMNAYHQEGLSGLGAFFVHQFLGIGGRPENLPLWFLRDLALWSLLAPLFLRLRSKGLIIVAVLLILLPLKEYIHIRDDMDYPSLDGLRMFLLGMALGPLSLKRLERVFGSILGTVVLAFSVGLSAYALWDHEVCFGIYPNLLGVSALMTAGVLAARYLPALGSLVSKIGGSFFIIYSSHVLILTLIFKVSIPLGYPVLPNLVWILLLPLLGYLPYLLRRALTLYCPRALRFFSP